MADAERKRIVILCHCPPHKWVRGHHRPIEVWNRADGTSEGLLNHEENEVIYIDLTCPNMDEVTEPLPYQYFKSMDDVPADSVDEIWPIHCPVYHLLRGENVLIGRALKILIGVRRLLKPQTGRFIIPVKREIIGTAVRRLDKLGLRETEEKTRSKVLAIGINEDVIDRKVIHLAFAKRPLSVEEEQRIQMAFIKRPISSVTGGKKRTKRTRRRTRKHA